MSLGLGLDEGQGSGLYYGENVFDSPGALNSGSGSTSTKGWGVLSAGAGEGVQVLVFVRDR